ncbi:MAG: hypothetical protein AAGG01_15160 [Planctomycetota bacterium]
MTSYKRLAKAAAAIGGITLLAAAVQAQASGGSTDIDWFLRFQISASTGGGTTTGSTGGSGGIITGSTPRPLSEVVVINPSQFTTP